MSNIVVFLILIFKTYESYFLRNKIGSIKSCKGIFLEYSKMFSRIIIFKWHYLEGAIKYPLIPKGPLSLRGTNGISGRYLRAEFLS